MYDIYYKDAASDEYIIVATDVPKDEVSQMITDLYLSSGTTEIGSGYYAERKSA